MMGWSTANNLKSGITFPFQPMLSSSDSHPLLYSSRGFPDKGEFDPHDSLTAQAALMYDAVFVLVEAFNKLLRKKPDMFRANLRRGQLFNATRGIECNTSKGWTMEVRCSGIRWLGGGEQAVGAPDRRTMDHPKRWFPLTKGNVWSPLFAIPLNTKHSWRILVS
ncbi:unnamed protein product [Nezara viridula]|uniref:Receptor ligand binding region domain-containing protein n=1 Tax=Nezara viridula TaxID=85310 RepID=A0A9P0H1R2_NEZVI|nr:unnamed protein product [Nezara viridula]